MAADPLLGRLLGLFPFCFGKDAELVLSFGVLISERSVTGVRVDRPRAESELLEGLKVLGGGSVVFVPRGWNPPLCLPLVPCVDDATCPKDSSTGATLLPIGFFMIVSPSFLSNAG